MTWYLIKHKDNFICVLSSPTADGSQDSSVGIATGYELNVRVSIPGVQIDFGAHPASYPIGTGTSFSRVKTAGDVKFTTHLQLMPRSKIVELYI
jgi:hypothetical protein